MKPRTRSPKRRQREIKPIPPLGPSGSVEARPIEGKAGRDYETGVPPVKRDPWRDEGEAEPETNG